MRDRLPARVPVEHWLAEGRFVDAAGTPLAPGAPYTPATFVWFHKDLRPEPAFPGEVPVLYRDERIVVVDKPHFLATTPGGMHVRATVLIMVRTALGLPELAPAHRLDRLTAGVLLFTTTRQWRATYQRVFQERAASKTYEALAPALPGPWPRTVRNHLVKPRGSLQAIEAPDAAPNAETQITLVESRGDLARYRLEPVTGRTHQLRVHLAGLGAPILGDPLYPAVSDAPEDPASPLRLVARTLAFTDPVDGVPRSFASRIALDWP
ncbi:pseudouridine synthase [Propioniciclava sp.]|uniref:pseudouridine synthase n=1 Tax=Propioniciclava sp. TaxID=2038686 RepID=UPI0039E59F20